ncbi:regulator of polyketide synthase expression [hydrocarbon metagenome]|uniref:Regulator of polyketide synthase expression n=1 Tax=hydrocarbon metagenome TaxID=938273 RepID=A0A0W8E6Z1_9ZZZZ
MKITMPMILDRLCDLDFEYSQSIMSERRQVSKVKFLQARHVSIDLDTLYITTFSYLTTEYKGDIPLYIACIKNVDIDIDVDHEIFTHTNLIIIKNLMEPSELFNLIQDIYFYYYDVYSQLLQIVEDNKGLQYLTDEISVLFGNPITITDRNFRILAITSSEPKNAELWRSIDETTRHNGYVTGSSDTYYLTKDYILKLNQNDKPVYFDTCEGYHSPMICLNIRMQKRNMAILSLFEIDTPFNIATSDLTVFISQILSVELQKNELLFLNSESNFAYPLADLLDGKTLSRSDVDKISNYFNYSVSNNYTVVVVKSPLSSDSSFELPFLRNKILNLLKCNSCIIYERSIVMVIDCSFLNSFNYCLPKFEKLLSDTMTYAGVSSSFSDFIEVRKGYIEASKAVELGLRMNIAGPVYLYMDFQFFHLIDLCSKQENIENLYHPALARLITYDQELSKTLYTYMRNNGSPAKTAKDLCIHRSSLAYRLKKIEEVLGIELNDYKTLLHLQLSYEIFNYLHSNFMTI